MSGLKIAIVGTAPSSRNLAPLGDESWTIWACSTGNIDISRWDAWFEIHDFTSIRNGFPDFVAMLESVTDKPVYLPHPDADIPAFQPFPHKHLKSEYGTEFLTSSISWMMAFAIEQSPEEIALYGVDMAQSTEYAEQRWGVLHFVDLARRRGIKVTIPDVSDLNIPRRTYAIDKPSPMAVKLDARMVELKARLNAVSTQKRALEHEETYLSGAIDDLSYIIRTFTQ